MNLVCLLKMYSLFLKNLIYSKGQMKLLIYTLLLIPLYYFTVK